MPRFMILKLEGVMQAWGGHTFEDYRPTNLFPTRSGLLGLLGACIGLERGNATELQKLFASVIFTVRADRAVLRPEWDSKMVEKRALRITDFHTVLEARKVDGKPNPNPVVSRREYLCDAAFTVAIENTPQATYGLDKLVQALKQPQYTPFLGRRSCPLIRPLFETFVEAEDAKSALDKIPPQGGTIYAEGMDLANDQRLMLRDVPIYGRYRKFSMRQVFIHAPLKGDDHVP